MWRVVEAKVVRPSFHFLFDLSHPILGIRKIRSHIESDTNNYESHEIYPDDDKDYEQRRRR